MTNATDYSDPRPAERIAQLFRESTAWIVQHSGEILLASLLGAAIVALLLGAKWLGERICAADPDHSTWRSTIGRTLSKAKLWFMLAVAAHIVAAYAHAPADLAHTIRFLFVVAAALQSAIFLRELILGTIEHRATGHESLGSALGIIRLLTTVALFSIAVVLILSNLGVNVTGLVAGLGIGGIAIGLAAQGIFRDLFAALSILLDRPFRVTDLIKFGDVIGRVEAIGLKSTRIRSLDGEEVVMSNDKLLDNQLRNYHDVEQRRIALNWPLHFGNAAAKLATLPQELERIVADIADARFGYAWLTDVIEDAITLQLVLYSTSGSADQRDRVRHEAIVATVAHLQATGIGFSYEATLPVQQLAAQ